MAGVAINLTIGDNGIFKRAQQATEEYSKSEVKEKIEMLLADFQIGKANGEESDLKKYLIKNLQVGVAINEDGNYTFNLGEWAITLNENQLISIEKFKINVDKTYPNVASMKADSGLTNGKLVQTEGYWDKQYGGSAYYDIVSSTSLTVDDTKCIQLDNGLYAELHPINDTVTVNQFGAYGDGEHDDAESIQSALNAGYGNVSFESARYKFGSPIMLSTDNLAVIGSNATIFWDETTEVPWQQFYIHGSSSNHINNINIISLNFENGNIKVKDNGESIQFLCQYVDNISIFNCKFNIYEIDGNKSRQITNLWFTDEWNNVTVQNCEFLNLTNSNAGGNIWLSSLTSDTNYISQNALIENNYIEKSSHDETIGIWGGTIENIIIQNNKFNIHEEKIDNPSDMNFTFGNQGIVRNIKFSNNELYCEAKGSCISVRGTTGSNYIEIDNNDIIYNKLGDDILYTGIIANDSDCILEISKNKIQYNLNEGDSGYLNVFALNNEVFNQNEITINGKIKSLQNMENGMNVNNNTKFEGNTITFNNEVDYLLEGYYFCNNTVKFNNGILLEQEDNASPAIFKYYRDIFKEIEIENNQIIIEHNEEWPERKIKFVLFSNVFLNNNNVNISNNNIIATNQTRQDLISLHINDSQSQKIYLNNNNYGIFKTIAVPFSNTHKIIVNGQEIVNETILD